MLLGVDDLVRFGPPGKPKVEGKVIRLGAKVRIRQVEAGHGEYQGTEWDVPRSPEYIEVIHRAQKPPPVSPLQRRRTSRPAPAPARAAAIVPPPVPSGLTEGWAISETQKLLSEWHIPTHFQIEFSNALTKALGRVNFRTSTISYSRKLWLRATDEEKRTVVIHEVAHVVVDHLHGRRAGTAHGRVWKLQMVRMGIPWGNVSPYHTIDRTGLKRSRVDTVGMSCCGGAEFRITMEKLRKSLNAAGETRMRCKRCDERPKLVSQDDLTKFQTYMKAFQLASGIAPNKLCGCGSH